MITPALVDHFLAGAAARAVMPFHRRSEQTRVVRWPVLPLWPCSAREWLILRWPESGGAPLLEVVELVAFDRTFEITEWPSELATWRVAPVSFGRAGVLSPNTSGPARYLEAVALAARFRLRLRALYVPKGANRRPDAVQIRHFTRAGLKADPDGGIRRILAHDLERAATRSYILEGMPALWLDRDGEPQDLPVWSLGVGYTGGQPLPGGGLVGDEKRARGTT